MRFFKHAKGKHDQKKHGNRGGKRATSEYEKMRSDFKAKSDRPKKSAGDKGLTDAFLRRAYGYYKVSPGDGIGTRKRKENQRKLAQRYASFKRGTRKTDPTGSFAKLLSAQEIRSVKIRVEGAFSRGAKGRTMPPRKDIIPDPKSFSRTVGARGHTDTIRRKVKPTGRVKRVAR